MRNKLRVAAALITAAEKDLGLLNYGWRVNLLADNTDWSLEDCETVVTRLEKYVKGLAKTPNLERIV